MSEGSQKDFNERESRKYVGKWISEKDFFDFTQTWGYCKILSVCLLYFFFKGRRKVLGSTSLGANFRRRSVRGNL